MSFRCSPVLAAAAALLFVLPAKADPPLATADSIRDFMIQNVCLDAAGAVLIGKSPLDDCAGRRDLRPGERLPYHKHDHPSPNERDDAPYGYQRHDSFPVETVGLGTVVEHSFDFGAGERRRFGIFDSPSDGGDIVVLSAGIAAIGATEDGGGGFGLWVGECEGPIAPAALARGWVVAQWEAERPAPLKGETVARLNGVRRGQDTCPVRFNRAYTTWRVLPFRYRANPGQGQPVTLPTLVSDHYSGADPASADSVERFYFTRELGGTRWEAWQNALGNRVHPATTIAERGDAFAASGRCSPVEPPEGGATWRLIDCREWTRIVPPADRAGDAPGFFIEAIRARGDFPALFAAPAARAR